MCALLVRRAHRGRADRGNARVARSAVRARRRGALPIELAMGSWERRHWGSLPPWETFFLRFLGLALTRLPYSNRDGTKLNESFVSYATRFIRTAYLNVFLYSIVPYHDPPDGETRSPRPRTSEVRAVVRRGRRTPRRPHARQRAEPSGTVHTVHADWTNGSGDGLSATGHMDAARRVPELSGDQCHRFFQLPQNGNSCASRCCARP
jgi:hypothetical protein